ncbi:MAG TPA: outer membrane protein transport protein [Candidatus Polarisedimenticolia bacterium]|jgi:long-subunit fatty acid transport protein
MTLKEALRLACVAMALLVSGLLAGSQAYSITDEEIFRDFRFNFINPGARSLGLGGAFVPISDDSTAALSNPAGLVWLKRPEFFEEFRLQAVESTETLDEFGAVNVASSTNPKNSFSPSFVSYVYPAEKWAVGISRQDLFNVDNRTTSVFGIGFGGPNVLEFTGLGQIDTEISNWNVSGAWKINDHISVGGSLVYSTMKMDAAVENSFVDSVGFLVDDGDPNTPCNLCGVPIAFYTTRIDDTEADLTYNLGVYWNLNKYVTAAASYRKGARYQLRNEIVTHFLDPSVTFFDPPVSDPNVVGPSAEITFNVPDSYSLGFAWRPLDRLILSLEGARIEYEDLLEGFTSGLNILTFKDCNEAHCSPAGEEHPGARFVTEDRTEVHFGAEYIFTVGANPLAVRAGYYTDPDNRIRAEFEEHDLTTLGGISTIPDGTSIFARDESFPARDDESHVTVGAGMVIQERFQIDVALDFSDIADQYVLSTIYRF